MRRGKLVLSVAALAGCLGSIPSSASAVALFVFGPGQPANVNTSSGSFNIGNEFTVGASALDTSAIGAFVGNDVAGGLTTVTFLASLYNSSNTLISSTLIPINTAVDSQGFAYVPFSTTLTAGATYTLTDIATDPTGNSNAPNTPFAYANSNFPAGTFNGVTFVQNRYISSPTSPASPTDSNNGGFQEFLGGNLQVPEPASLGLLSIGALGLLARRRRA